MLAHGAHSTPSTAPAAATVATAARSSGPPTTVNGSGTPASHSPAYASGLLVLPTSSHRPSGSSRRSPSVGRIHGRTSASGSVEDEVGVVLPPLAEVGLERGGRVEVGRHVEGALEQLHLGDPVDAEGPQRVGVVRVAQQVPPAVAHHHRPRVHLEGPGVAGRRAVADAHLPLGGDRGDQPARDLRVGPDRRPLGHGARGLPHRGRLPRDVGRQHPQDLAERGAHRVVGVGDRVLGVEGGHHQPERLGRREDQRRQPEPAPQRVAAVGTARGLDRDVGLAQDRDVAPRGALGDAEALGELARR